MSTGNRVGPLPLSGTKSQRFQYERPSEFLDLAAVPNPGVTEIFTALVAVLPPPQPSKYVGQLYGAPTLSAVNYVAFHADVNSGSIRIDWGDGSAIETLASGSNTFHTYDYDDLPASSEFRGYRQAVLSAIPATDGSKFSDIRTDLDGPFVPSFTSSHGRCGSNLLDMTMSSGLATSMDIGGQSRPHKMCEQVALYNTTNNRLTNAQNAFYSGMQSLQNIKNVPYMHVDTTESHSQAFRFCTKLKVLSDQFAEPDRYWFWNSSSFYLCFDYCYELAYLPEGLFDKQGETSELANCQDFRYMFRFNFNLPYIPRLPVRTSGSHIHVGFMFQDCQALRRIPDDFKANNITSSSSLGMRSLFQNNLLLEDFNDFKLSDVNGGSPATDSIECGGIFREVRKFEIMPWLGYNPYQLNSRHDLGGAGIMRTRSQHGYAPEYFTDPAWDLTRITDFQDGMNSNYCVKEYPILNFSPNTLTNSNAMFRVFFQNWNLKTVTFSGFNTNETFGNGEYYQCFYNCTNLNVISGLPFNAANDSGDYSGTFSNANSIGHFGFPGVSADETGFSESISLRYMPLDIANIENIFRYLETVGGKTITLTNNSYADNLPSEITAIATGKGWTVTT